MIVSHILGLRSSLKDLLYNGSGKLWNGLTHFGVERTNKNDPRQLKNLACKDDINELSRKIDDLQEELNKPINDIQQLLNKFQSVQLQNRWLDDWVDSINPAYQRYLKKDSDLSIQYWTNRSGNPEK